MRSSNSLSLAAISLALLFLLPASPVQATKRPAYGGTLRVVLRAPSISLDPREWKPGSASSAQNKQFAVLIYDRLLTLDDYGRFQPALATEWSHDAAMRNWQFKLRPGVKFSDGSPLTATNVVAALQPLLAAGLQISAAENAISIHSSHPVPDLLEQLSSGRYFVYRALPDGLLLGTGPFYLGEDSPAAPSETNPSVMKPAHMKFRASEEAWSGRPFLDAIEITLGEPALRLLYDLQVGKADLAEIAPDLVRKARQENVRIWSSAPNTLLALRFDDAQPGAADQRLRQALSFSLDRDTMANVLLQRQALPTAALLPQWLSGYAFLFDSPMSLEHAKEIRASLPANVASLSEPLRLRVDSSGDLMKLLGERVAVNARQANLSVQVLLPHDAGNSSALPSVKSASAGLHLFAWHYDTVSPRAELDALARQFALQDSGEGTQAVSDPEQLFALERRLLDERRILPLVVLPEYIGIAGNVRNWSPARWGELRLADVWLDQSPNAPVADENRAPRSSSFPRTSGGRP
ncbi:MAG TPA: ABC transporter substrate-binding protein [Candidatus Acidoferrum sp.]|jgi:MarR-like DNA-binding transcriptional regulator SgrR of sgrS sRNA